MSTNSECEFFEPEPGKWFYALEDYFAPKNAWSWREHARGFGPFASEDEADEHLRANHPNPGGSSTTPHAEFRMDDAYRKLIDGAPENMKAFGSGFGFGRRY